MAKQFTAIGVFADQAQAQKALEALQQAGFRDQQLGALTRGAHTEEQKTTSVAEQEVHHGPNALARGLVGGIMGAIDILLVPITGPADASLMLESTLPVAEEALDRLPYPGSRNDEAATLRPDAPMTETVNAQHTPNTTRAEEIATTADTPDVNATADTDAERSSVLTGSVVGGVLGAAAALFIPGIGPAIAGGILATIFSGAAVGSVAGGFLGAFTTMGIPEGRARNYVEEFKAGRTIVTVRTDSNPQEASSILSSYGAHSVETHKM